VVHALDGVPAGAAEGDASMVGLGRAGAQQGEHRGGRQRCRPPERLAARRVSRECADDGIEAIRIHQVSPVVLSAPPHVVRQTPLSRGPRRHIGGHGNWQTPPAQTREPQHWAPKVHSPSYQQQRESSVETVYSQMAPVWGRRHWSVV